MIVLACFQYFEQIFIFRGPIYGLFWLFTNVLAIYKHMATLKMKSDLILLLRKLKNLLI